MEENKLANIIARAQQKVVQDRQAMQSKQTADQLSAIDDTILKSFKILVDYLSKRTSKTEVVNQLKSISTPDVEKVVAAVNELTNVTIDQKLNPEPLIELLTRIQDELIKIPTEHAEAVEQREDVKVTNLSEIKIPEFDTSNLEKAINNLKLKAPDVKVAAPNVKVDAPDLGPLKTELINIVKAIKEQKYPEVPKINLSQVESELKTSNVKLQELIEKPGPVMGPTTPYVSNDGTGKPVMVTLTADGKIPVEAGSTSAYEGRNDTTTDANLVYLGKALPGSDVTDAVWQIKRYNKSAGHMSFADDITTFTKQWSERTTYVY